MKSALSCYTTESLGTSTTCVLSDGTVYPTLAAFIDEQRLGIQTAEACLTQ
jgi:hypothetical protein